MPNEAPEGFELRYTEGDNLPYYQKIADIPSEPSDDLNSDPFARAASRMRRSVVHDRLPIQDRPSTQSDYLVEPDLLEAQQGQHLPTDMAVNDAGIPFNLKTGEEIPTVRRPNVLPVAMTPDGPRWAMPKVLDLAGNIMGGVAGVPAKAGEVVLGSGVVRKMADETAGPFFSSLERAVDTAKIGMASADQWLGYLKNQPGVKAEEINTVLGDLKGTLSKSEVQDIIKNNKVELGEKVLGNKLNEQEIQNLYKREQELIAKGKDATKAEKQEWADIKNKLNEAGTPTKYHSYQLPGGENYKEMLLTLPAQENFGVKAAEGKYRLFDYKTNDYVRTPDGKVRTGFDNETAAKEAADGLNKTSGSNPMQNFKSSHWDEPNILAHIRMNDRTVEGKKTLHLEELQSDWHQKGRKEGYKLSEKQKADLDTIENKLTTKLSEAEIGHPDIDNVLKVAVEKKVISTDDAKNYKDYVKGENSTVPDAPFKKNWDELALKRMLHHAAVNDYHGLSWTPGEAQRTNPKILGSGTEAQREIADKGLQQFYNETLVNKANNLVKKYGSKVEQKELSHNKTYKIEPIEVRNMNGGNSQVYDVRFNLNGGEDRLIASYKTKAEAEIKLKELQATKGEPIHYLPITPELRAKAKQGFPLFSSVPVTVPVDFDPFERKNYKLTPVEGNPFDPKANAAGIESHRNNGGRADLNNPVSPGAAPSYGIRPAIMDPNNPEFENFQPNSLE